MLQNQGHTLDKNENVILNGVLESSKLFPKFGQIIEEKLIDLNRLETGRNDEVFSILFEKTKEIEALKLKVEECNEKLEDSEKKCRSLLEERDRRVLYVSSPCAYGDGESEQIISDLEKSEKELIAFIGKLQQENVSLRSRLEDCKLEKAEFDGKEREFVDKKINFEKTFKRQEEELAKFKHLLFSSEKEVKRLQFELNENVRCYVGSRERCDELQNLLANSTKKNKNSINSIEEMKTEKKKLNKKVTEIDKTNKLLSAENGALKEKLSFLNGDLRKVRRSLSSVEVTHRNVSDKYEYLRQSSETVLTKAQTDLEKKECLIETLKRRVKSMEEKIEAEKLPQSEQMQIVLKQNSSLEERLEKVTEQLNNVKVTWSDRINHLETQVSHLNAKIAEDQEEIFEKSEEVESLRAKLDDEKKRLSSTIAAMKEENERIRSEKEEMKKNFEEFRLRTHIMESDDVEEVNRQKQDLEFFLRNVEKSIQEQVQALSTKFKESVEIVDRLKAIEFDISPCDSP